MAKRKRQKSYESAGIQFGTGWLLNDPPKLRKKDALRKMIREAQKQKGG